MSRSQVEPSAVRAKLITALLTAVAMLAFAANSLLCRQALGAGLIDPASFTSVRVLAGALALGLIMLPRWRAHGRALADWRGASALFAYMICFSIAYLSLSAGTGALILFAAVQLTMFLVALRSGESFAGPSWGGLLLAIAGLVYLVAPGVTAPDPFGALLMAIAGIAWGLYSLLGRRSGDPLRATASNFLYAVPMVAATSLLAMREFHVTPIGVALATASGAVASGLGYFVSYAAVKRQSAIRAATVQLSVPMLAALGGVVLLEEVLTLRLCLASAATLGGVAIVLVQKATR